MLQKWRVVIVIVIPLQVALHQVSDDIHVRDVHRARGGGHDIQNSDNVFMSIEMSQEFDLTKNALCINEIDEYVSDFLDSYFFSSFLSKYK